MTELAAKAVAVTVKGVATARDSHTVGQVAGIAIGSAGLVAFFEAVTPIVGGVTALLGALLAAVTLVIKIRKEYRDTVEFKRKEKEQ